MLACADGGSNTAVGTELGVHPVTVAKWRKRFAADGLQGLSDEPRPGPPRTVSDEKVEEVVVRTLDTPKNATHWSTREMAAASGLSQSTVSRIWRTFGLKPHLVDTFKLDENR
ncbi:helix-turn-helix domain-containing protein [Streptomyces sp. NPDC000994]